MALSKSHRLSLRFNRKRLDDNGKTFFGKNFTVVIADTPIDLLEVSSPRFAILLSKKTARQAVDRNKIKRITSSIIESNLNEISKKDYLIIPKSSVLKEEYKKISEDLKSLLLK